MAGTGKSSGVDEIGCVAVASTAFGERNQGQSSEKSVTEAGRIIRFAAERGVVAQVSIAVAFGCPYDGAVAPSYVVDLAARLAEYAPVEIALADTIGAAVPAQVRHLFSRIRAVVPPSIRLRAHFHDTNNTGIANAWAAYEEGVRVFDASVGGLGGCSFAPGALGNIATEDLVYLMQKSGVETHLDRQALIAASQ
jgi:hydroxymethylglutaryl-CoA lyase